MLLEKKKQGTILNAAIANLPVGQHAELLNTAKTETFELEIVKKNADKHLSAQLDEAALRQKKPFN